MEDFSQVLKSQVKVLIEDKILVNVVVGDKKVGEKFGQVQKSWENIWSREKLFTTLKKLVTFPQLFFPDKVGGKE